MFGGGEEGVAGGAGVRKASVRDLPLPFDDHDRQKARLGLRQIARAVHEVLRHGKVLALADDRLHEVRSHDRVVAVERPGRDRVHIEDVERLFDVQLPLVAVLVAAAVVVQPVGDVGGLLHFADKAPRADGVYRPCRQEVGIPLLDGYAVQNLHQRIVRDAPAELPRRDVAVEPDIDAGVLVCVEDVPHLALAVLPLHRERVLVGGVHLDGQILLGVDELDHDGELLVPLRLPAQLIFADGFDIFGEGHARELALGDRRFPVRMGGKLPALGDDIHIADVLVKDVADLRPAPEVVLEHGLEPNEEFGLFAALMRVRLLTADGA